MRNQTYSNQNFDRQQGLAYRLTDSARAEGKPGTPAYGYSKENWNLAGTMLANEEEGKPETYITI